MAKSADKGSASAGPSLFLVTCDDLGGVFSRGQVVSREQLLGAASGVDIAWLIEVGSIEPQSPPAEPKDDSGTGEGEPKGDSVEGGADTGEQKPPEG
ncbi:MAG TPA: hypothetical protein VGN26_12440 [Armatimonadota bacterium]|jgi:hypothetical protein